MYGNTSSDTEQFTNYTGTTLLIYSNTDVYNYLPVPRRPPKIVVEKIEKGACHEEIAAFLAALLRATAPLPPLTTPVVELQPVQRSAGCRDAKLRYWRTRALVHR